MCADVCFSFTLKANRGLCGEFHTKLQTGPRVSVLTGDELG